MDTPTPRCATSPLHYTAANSSAFFPVNRVPNPLFRDYEKNRKFARWRDHCVADVLRSASQSITWVFLLIPRRDTPPLDVFTHYTVYAISYTAQHRLFYLSSIAVFHSVPHHCKTVYSLICLYTCDHHSD